MNHPPKKPRHADPGSFRRRAKWARELGRCDAFDDVLAIWETSDREIDSLRRKQESELEGALARSRAQTFKAALVGLLALVSMGVPIAYLAHSATPADPEVRIGEVASALDALKHDGTESASR